MLQRPCPGGCGRLTTGKRCPGCEQARNQARVHYQGDYQQRAARIRATTTLCALCGEGPRDDDPWQADHVRPADPSSPLQGAHRSCNIARSNQARADE